MTGEQRINQGNYPYLATYTFSQPHAEYQFGDHFITTARPNGFNANLKWEETTSYDVGLDYGFFNGRLSGTIDAYYRQTNDLLNVVPVPVGTNFTNRILSNVGTMEIKGIEFSITGRPISTKNGYLQISFNASHNVNKITKLTIVNDPDYQGVFVGGISGGTGNTIQVNSVGYPRRSFTYISKYTIKMVIQLKAFTRISTAMVSLTHSTNIDTMIQPQAGEWHLPPGSSIKTGI